MNECSCNDYKLFMCWDCAACTNCISEYYMVDDDLWYSATDEQDTPTDVMLCIGCLENRLGGQLVASDFTDAPVNRGFFFYSTRLQSRLTNHAAAANF